MGTVSLSTVLSIVGQLASASSPVLLAFIALALMFGIGIMPVYVHAKIVEIKDGQLKEYETRIVAAEERRNQIESERNALLDEIRRQATINEQVGTILDAVHARALTLDRARREPPYPARGGSARGSRTAPAAARG